MYYRVSGAPFTLKDAQEKKEFIDTINTDQNFTKHLSCLGVDAEQFTGQIHNVIARDKDSNRVYAFSCSGTFPTLTLSYKDSMFTHVITFPVSKNGQTVVNKELESPTTISEEKSVVVETPVAPVETPVSAPVVEEKPSPSKRGRKKKQH